MERLSSIQWAKKYEISGLYDYKKKCKLFILDPDGWDRKNFNKSIKEKITKIEFWKRCFESTMEVRANDFLNSMVEEIYGDRKGRNKSN